MTKDAMTAQEVLRAAEKLAADAEPGSAAEALAVLVQMSARQAMLIESLDSKIVALRGQQLADADVLTALGEATVGSLRALMDIKRAVMWLAALGALVLISVLVTGV